MASCISSRMHFLCFSLIAVMMITHVNSSPTPSQLSPTFYNFRCPGVYGTIRSVIQAAVRNERRMGASLIRLFFHDCFVNGCDASILLTGPGNTSELNALPNINSVRGMDVIANAKAAVDRLCGPGIISCADIVAVAARDSVVELGGPNFDIPVGRRDGLIANFSGANSDLPGFFESLGNITAKFNQKGLTQQEMVVLSGAHTVGQAQCFTFKDRIYNETNIDPAFANLRKANCPPSGGDSNLAPLDVQTPNFFDNAYFRNLLQFKGLLHSDQVLFNRGPTDNQVLFYSGYQKGFFFDFANAMIRMGNIDVLTGTEGQIRNNCSRIN